MQKEYKVYCPFIEVQIKEISCELIDNFGNFPMQILLAVNDGNSIKEIAKGVLVDERVVENTVEELIQKNIIVKKTGIRIRKCPYEPTDNGKKYIAMYKIIRQFREQNNELFAVNCFTCRMEQIRDQRFVIHSKNEIPSDCAVLKNKLQGSEHLLESPDYENTHEYMHDRLNLDSVSLTDDDYAFIHFRISPVNKRDVFFVPYLIPEKLVRNFKKQKETECIVHISIPVQKAKRIFLSDLERQDDAAQLTAAIRFLNEYHQECLSDKGKMLLKKHDYAEKYTKECKTLFMDCFTGLEFTESLETNFRQRADIILPVVHRFKEGIIPMNQKGMDGFYYRYDSLGITYITVPIPFTELQQKGGETYR